MTAVSLRTGAWYADVEVRLDLPDSWQSLVYRPELPRPVTTREIRARRDGPEGDGLRQLAASARRPVVLVDDLTRPTPAASVLPALLALLADATGARVTVIVATGSHAAPTQAGLGPIPFS